MKLTVEQASAYRESCRLIKPDLAQAIFEAQDRPETGLRPDHWDYIEILAQEQFWRNLIAEPEVPIDPSDCIAAALVDYERQSTK